MISSARDDLLVARLEKELNGTIFSAGDSS
jgi:hypothetical protein